MVSSVVQTVSLHALHFTSVGVYSAPHDDNNDFSSLFITLDTIADCPLAEFKELRKQWRKSKKEEADARAAASAVMGRSAHHAYLSRGMHDSYADVDYQLRSHPQQGSHVDRFTPTASPEEMHDIDMQDVYERRQQRFSGLFPSTSRTSSPTYTATHSSNMPSSHTAMARLPTNSTLLTPLPGYEHAGATTDLNTYASYGVYPDNRPGSGHGSIGSYDETRRSG